MKKYQLRERAILLLIYAFLKEGYRLLGIDFKSVNLADFEDIYDIKLTTLVQKLSRLNKSYANEKIIEFFNKRTKNVRDEIEKECQPLFIGLLIFYFYKLIDDKKDFVLNELNIQEIKEILYEHHKEFIISNCTVNKAKELFLCIYPEKKVVIEWLESRNKFPFNSIRSDNG